MTLATYKNEIIYDNGILDPGDRNYKIFSAPSPTCAWNSTTKANRITGRYYKLNHAGGEGPYINKEINGNFQTSDDWDFGVDWVFDDGAAAHSLPKAVHLAGARSIIFMPLTNIPIITGRTYRISYTVADWSGGAMACYLKSNYFGAANANGIYTSTVTMADLDYGTMYTNRLLFYPSTTGQSISITHVSIELRDEEDVELFTTIYDTNFAYQEDWVVDAGNWHFEVGRLYHPKGGTAALTYTDFVPTVGKEYYVEFRVTGITGDVNCYLGGQTVVSGLYNGGVYYKVITATTTAGLTFTCENLKYAGITDVVIKELDNYLDFTLDMSGSILDITNGLYPYFGNLNYSKQIAEDTIIALSPYYSYKTWYTGVDHEDGRTDSYQYRRSLLTFDDTSDYLLDYLDETYTYFNRDQSTTSGTWTRNEYTYNHTYKYYEWIDVTHSMSDTIDTNNYAGYDLHATPIVLNGFDNMYAIFPGKKSEQIYKEEYAGVHFFNSDSPASPAWTWIVRNRQQWVKYATAKVFKFSAAGTETFEVCDEVLNLQNDYYNTPWHLCEDYDPLICPGGYPSGNDEYLYYSGYGEIFTQTIKMHHTTKDDDIFWSIYYRYSTRYYYDLAGSGTNTVEKLRFYKNGTFLEEIDAANGEESLNYYLGEDNQILHVSTIVWPTDKGSSILDSEGTVLTTPYAGYSIVNLIYLPAKEATEEGPAREAEYIIAVVDDIQGEGDFFGLYRYDSEWNLIESRNIWATDLGALASNSYGANPNNYWAKNGDTILQGCQPLITNPMFKCIGGFRSVKQDYLFSGYDKAWSYGEPWRYLGFAQSVLPWF